MCWRKCASVCIIVAYQCQYHWNLCLRFDFVIDRQTERKTIQWTTLSTDHQIQYWLSNKLNFKASNNTNKSTLNAILLSIRRNRPTQIRISQLKSYTVVEFVADARVNWMCFLSLACYPNWIRVPLCSVDHFACVIYQSFNAILFPFF